MKERPVMTTAARCPVDHLDLVDPDTFAAGLPLEAFATMRDEAPVFWHEQPATQDGGFWVVTRLEDVREVSRTPEVFSSYARGALLTTTGPEEEEVALAMTRQLMLNMDPPEHGAYRQIVQRAFTPRTIRNLEGRLQEFADDIVDRALAKGTGDFVTDVAAELPPLAICELVGVPAEQRQAVFELSNRMVGFDDPELGGSPEESQAAMAEMFVMADALAQDKKGCPGQDIISKLLEAETGTGALTPDQFAIFFVLLMVAGNETTRNAITHGMQAFFEHPEQWELYQRERPEGAVEEIIRGAAPIIQSQRCALAYYALGGQQIKANDRVVIYYSAANRDERGLLEPDAFDITRADNEHVAFGGGGPHFCLGANLARAEIRIIFDTIARRMPDIAPLGAPRPLRSNFVHGIKELPVRYTS
jgi:cholest-4-en-3-one 26-monooxygenase